MDRRAHYIETALHLFTAHGFHGVTVDEVVAEAGGSKATLYRYFRSKRELFEAIIDDLGASNLPPAVESADAAPLDEALRAFGHGVAAAALSERAIVLLRLAIGEAARFPELGQALFERGPALSYARFAALVAPHVESRELAIADIDVAAEQFIGGIVGHQQLRMALAVSTPTPAEIDTRVEAAVTAFLATYAS